MWGTAAQPIDSRGVPHMESLWRTAIPAVSEAGDNQQGSRRFAHHQSRRVDLPAAETTGADRLSLIAHWADVDGVAHGQLHLVSQMPPLPVGGGSSLPPLPMTSLGALPMPDGIQSDNENIPSPTKRKAADSLNSALCMALGATDAIYRHACGVPPSRLVSVRISVQNCFRRTALAFRLQMARSRFSGIANYQLSKQHAAQAQIASGTCVALGCTCSAEQWLPPATSTTLFFNMAATEDGTFSVQDTYLTLQAWKVMGAETRPLREPLLWQLPLRALHVTARER